MKDREPKQPGNNRNTPAEQAGMDPVELGQRMAALSDRERAVAAAIAQGYSSREIAEKLRLSEMAAVTHELRLRMKLGARSRAELHHLLALAFSNGHGNPGTG